MTDPPSGWRRGSRRSGAGEAVDLVSLLTLIVSRSRDTVDRGAARALARTSAGRRTAGRVLSARPLWQWLFVVGLVVAVGLGAVVSPGAASTTEISGCGPIDESGTYVLTNDTTATTHDCLNVTASDVVIEGQNHTLTQTDVGNGTGVAIDPGVSNVTVRNLTTKDWGRGLGLDGVANATVRNVRLRGGGTGLSLQNASNAVVEDATFVGNDGVEASNASNLAMDDVVYENVTTELTLDTGPATLSNLTLRGSPGIRVRTDGVTVRDALVADHGGDPGVTVDSPAGTDLENVTVRRSSGVGIRIKSSDVLVSNATLADGDGALELQSGASNVTVVDSEMVGNSDGDSSAAVVLGSGSDIRFVGNNVSNNGGVGVKGGPDDLTMADTEISNNGGTGIDLANDLVTNLSIRNVTVADNEGHGFHNSEGNNVTFANSTFANNTKRGIWARNVDPGTLTIDDNVVRENGRDGIYVDTSTGARIQSNLVRSNGGKGIDVGSSDVVLLRNSVTNNTHGIYLDTDDNATLRGNALLNNSEAGAYFHGSRFSSLNGTRLRDNGVGIRAGGANEINGTDVDLGASTAPNTTIDFVAQSVNVSGVTHPAEPPAGNASIQRFVNATALPTSSTVFDFDLHYEPDDLWGVNESTLAIWRDGGDGNWSQTGTSSLNTSANVVSANPSSSFGEFGAFGDATGPAYHVDVDNTSSPVVEGESLRVNATVTNEGGTNGTQTVNLTIADAERDNVTLSLNASETRSVALNWSTEPGDAGEYTATVASENDTATANVTVQEPANFSVEMDAPTDSVLEGEPLTVTANVTNDGDVEETQTVNLTVGEDEVANRSVPLGGGNSSTVDLRWNTTRGDNGTHTATVNTEDDSTSQQVTVDALPYLDVELVGNDSPVTEGQNLTVTANVTNTGDRQTTQVVNLSIEGTPGEVANESVALDGGNWTHVALNWSTAVGQNGTYDATVASENDTATATDLAVEALPTFDVEIVDYEDTLTAGELLNVTANVTNVGDLAGNQSVTLSVNDTPGEDDESVPLDGGNATNVTLTWNTTNATPANYTATVASENDSDARSVSVLPSSAFEVSIAGTNGPVTEGETLSVDANVSYRASSNASQTIALNVSGRQDSQVVNFTEPGTEEITLEWGTSSGDAGEHVAVVASENDTARRNVTVEAASGGGGIVLPPGDGDDGDSVGGGPTFDVAIVAVDDPVHVGERLTAVANVTNVGGASGTDEVELVANGTRRDGRNVTLAVNASRTVELNWTPAAGDVGEHRAVVRTDADARARYVEATERPTLDVSIEGTNAPISAGDRLEVTARVTATGAANGTIELLAPDDRRVDAREVSLAANESRTLSLQWGTSASDAGRRTVTVRGPDDAATATVELTSAPNLGVTLFSAPGRVEVNETMVVRAAISNAGDETADSRAVLVVGGRERVDTRLTLAGGEERTVELAWTPTREHVGTHRTVVRAGSGQAASDVTVANASGDPIAPGLPAWTSESVDYRPTEQDAHVGGFLWLTGVLAGLGGYVLLTRRALEGRLLGGTLLVAAGRTTTDVLHASVGGLQTGHLVGLNTVLELYAGVCFLGFAAAFVDHGWLRSRRGGAALAGAAALGTVATASNPVHGLVYTDVGLADDAFTYVTADTGPLGWVLLAATVASVVCSVALLARSFLSGRDPAWRPVGVLVAGLCLGTVAVLASALERGPIPQYDYTGAGVAGVLLTTTTTLFGHGLHRIKQTAQKSLIEDLDDPIVIANDARVVVEFNDAAASLLPGLAVGAQLDSLLGFEVEWPDAGETTSVERSRAELLPGSPEREPATDGSGLGRSGVERAEAGGAGTGGAENHRTETEGAENHRTGGAENHRTEGGENHRAAIDAADPRPAGTDEADAAATEPDGSAIERDGSRPADRGADGRDAAPADDREASSAAESGHVVRDAGGAAGATDESDGEQHFLVQTTPVTAETGDSIGYTIRFTDVTALKRRTKALAGKNAQLEQVASTISHDLRNPMTVASGYVEQLRVTTPDPDSGEPVREPAALGEMLGHVRASLERMEDIIDDVLALARSAEPVTTRPGVAFGEVVADAWATVETDDARLTLDADGTLEADRQRLQRMFENLFRNSIDHVGDDVHVTATLTGNGFAVADDGPGIPPGDRDQVFEQGYTSSQSGTGLGLSIVQQLARAHDWAVALDPDADGARFVVTGCDVELGDGEDSDARVVGDEAGSGTAGDASNGTDDVASGTDREEPIPADEASIRTAEEEASNGTDEEEPSARTAEEEAPGEADDVWDWAGDGSSDVGDEPEDADESA